MYLSNLSEGEYMECQRCLNNDKIKGIVFKNGICSVCNEYEKIKEYIEDYNNLGKMWLRKINHYRDKKKYDALIGISGGKDSSYVLSELIERYKLNVCCVTFDNGFLSRRAKDNIEKIIKKYNVNHKYILLPERIRNQIYTISEQVYGNQCMGCTFLMYAALKEYAANSDIAMMINGRSQYQIYSKIGITKQSPFKEFEDNVLLNDQLKRYYPNYYIETDVPYLSYFMYHKYDKSIIKRELKERFDWNSEYINTDEEEHFDCEAHRDAFKRFYMNNGYSQNLLEVSHMVRTGKLLKEEARTLINNE